MNEIARNYNDPLTKRSFDNQQGSKLHNGGKKNKNKKPTNKNNSH